MCDIRFQVDCGDREERKGKNMISFAIKTMFIGDNNNQEEADPKLIKKNHKKSRHLLPRLKHFFTGYESNKVVQWFLYWI